MSILLIILGVLGICAAVCALFAYLIYLVAVALFWVLAITFVGLSTMFSNMTGDPYIGIGLGIVGTLLLFALLGHVSEKRSKNN